MTLVHSTKRLLIVDDDATFADRLSVVLKSDFDVRAVYSLKSALTELMKAPYDIVLSDFVLADRTGFELLKSLELYSSRPKVFFMTAFADKDMAISLLNQGIEGLIEKPFSVKELITLIQKSDHSDLDTSLAMNDWIMDPISRKLVTDRREVELTEVEFQLLFCLLSRQLSWVSREEVVTQIWGPGFRSRNILDTHLTNLKRKVPELKNHLRVVRGRGYMFSRGTPCTD